MPLYIIKCESCNLETEILCSYDHMKSMRCASCNGSIILLPSKIAGFYINGYCAANNYDNPEKMNYDGTKPDW